MRGISDLDSFTPYVVCVGRELGLVELWPLTDCREAMRSKNFHRVMRVPSIADQERLKNELGDAWVFVQSVFSEVPVCFTLLEAGVRVGVSFKSSVEENPELNWPKLRGF